MFLKLTRMNALGAEVGPIHVNLDLVVALSPSAELVNSMRLTTLVNEANALILVKETPEEILNKSVVLSAPVSTTTIT